MLRWFVFAVPLSHQAADMLIIRTNGVSNLLPLSAI